ncbi:toxin-antitoxin system HicB family antitoxin [Methylobacterium sp. 174MFSha1.1]|uniref:toxin-antitoxin system HicB family antitoxin n=1 Tax=Methylobacterium sp. 174MFSha1.1 TaxID=1502749 RepID=UPI0011609954|nr:toxin-antitoxin system HicB family antitoxin [Methylobacterium sp. 174MFSha1.1]
MTYKGFVARVEFIADDSAFIGRIAGINDIIGFHVESVADLTSAFHEAVDDDIETCVPKRQKFIGPHDHQAATTAHDGARRADRAGGRSS